MIVYALNGPSGTGKSTAALGYAYEQQIEGIIDDGLYIYKGKKQAGTSAKFEKNTIKAVKRAIFTEEAHALEVQRAIAETKPKKLLIIGTSEKMLKKIAEKLQVEITEIISIDSIRTQTEIRLARFMRHVAGQHTMPVPMQQIEQNFFSRLIRKGMEIFTLKSEKIGETTIVQPDFHQAQTTIDIQQMPNEFREIIERNPYVTIRDLQFNLLPLPSLRVYVAICIPLHHQLGPLLTETQKEVVTLMNERFDLQFDNFTLHLIEVVQGEEA